MLNPQYQLKSSIKCAKVCEHTHTSYWGSHIHVTNMLNPQYQLKSSIKCAKVREHTHTSYWGNHIHVTNMLNPQYQLKSSIKCAKVREHTHTSYWGNHIHNNHAESTVPAHLFYTDGLSVTHTYSYSGCPTRWPSKKYISPALNMARVQTHYPHPHPHPGHIRTKVYIHNKICNNIDLFMRETTCLSSWQNVSETHSFITRRTVTPVKIRPPHLRPSISWDHLPHFKNNNSFSS